MEHSEQKSGLLQMTIAQYARHRNCRESAVRYAIATGKLLKSLSKKPNGTVSIEVEIADGEWKMNRRQPFTSADHVGPDEGQGRTSRERKDAADAALAELKLERERALVIDVEEVKRAAFKVGRSVRDAMLNIPDRLAAELAAETDQFKVHQRMTEEIRRALENLTNETVGNDADEIEGEPE